MKLIAIILIFVAVMSACEKSEFNDLSGPMTMSGRVLLKDTINGSNYIVPVKSIEVFLSDLKDTTTFLNSKKTDANGNYSFGGIDPTVGYKIFAKTDTGTIKYYGQLKYKVGELKEKFEPLMLEPDADTQNGVHVIVQDTNKSRLSNIKIWIYSNSEFYNAGTAEGKALELTSNSAGIANKLNLTPQTYYLLVKGRIGNIDITSRAIKEIKSKGFSTVVLTVVTNPKENGMEIEITDSSKVPIQGATVFAYRSQTIYNLDKTGASSLFSMLSDKAGMATAYNIDSAFYYLSAIKVIGKDTLKGKRTISVDSKGIKKERIILN